MINVSYSVQADGKWYEHRYNQCDHGVSCIYGGVKCQGVSGHDGPHWAYSPIGDLHLDFDPPVDDIGASQTPDGHPLYVRPRDMRQQYYANHAQITEVTDPELLEWLGPPSEPELSEEETRLLMSG